MSTSNPPVALITGAASGMGLALTHHLLAKGYKVGMCDLNAPLLTTEANKITTIFPNNTDRIFHRALDITDYKSHALFFRDVFTWGGGHIDYFAANAGITEKDSLHMKATRIPIDADGLPQQLSQTAIDVNLKAVVDGIWLYRFYAARRSDGRTGGRITVTASTAGLYPYKGMPLYGASKHAVVGLVRCTAPLLAKEGILVNAVCPSFVRTGLLPEAMLKVWPQEYLTKMETVLRVHGLFLEGGGSGQTVETSGDELFWREHVPYADERTRWIAEESGGVWGRLRGVLPSKM